MINIIKLPFDVPEKNIVELSKDKIPKYKGWRCGQRFRPFKDPTAITCEKYDNGYYLFVLDFDYKDKWENQIYQKFASKFNTYTRETKNGLHLFYWSPSPCDIMQSKTHIHVDLRRQTSIGVNNNRRGNYIVLYDLPTNKLPVTVIDCNILIEELYKMNNEPIRHYGDTFIYKHKKENYTFKKPNITARHRAIALYLRNNKKDWTHAYDISFKWGLKLSGVLADENEAEAIATALMELVEYPHKRNWIINFLNGFNCGDKKPYVNIGKTYLKYGQLFYLAEKLKAYDSVNMDEFLEAFEDLKLHQFIKLAKEVKKWN